jgi:putative DNA primase/helicase
MVSIYETSKSLKLDPALLKTLAGNDPVTARDMYARPETFTPQFTLWMASNYRPGLPSDDDAVWERLREIPFDVQVDKEKRDPAVRATLNDPDRAGPAVLAWAAKGLELYYKSGLVTPVTVETATDAYKDQMDALAEFGEDCLVFGDASIFQATPKDIRGALANWCRTSGAEFVPAAELTQWLEGRGCKRVMKSNPRRRVWVGVGVRHEEVGGAA